MKLKHLTDQQLLLDTRARAASERAATVLVLEHIQEVHRRKLFAELGHPSLFKYLVKELHYSEAQAYRRIQAARLMSDLPETKSKIASGSLNLSKASKLQSFFNEQRSNKKQTADQAPTQVSRQAVKLEKLALIEHMESKSGRECESLLNQLRDPNAKEHFKLSLKLNEAQKTKWLRLQGLLAHKNLDQEQLLELLVDKALEQLDPQKNKRAYQKKTITQNHIQETSPRMIPAALKRQLWQRAQGTCEWVGAQGQKCESNWALQVDHVCDYALGGPTVVENLQLLCRAHHQRKSIETWGLRQ